MKGSPREDVADVFYCLLSLPPRKGAVSWGGFASGPCRRSFSDRPRPPEGSPRPGGGPPRESGPLPGGPKLKNLRGPKRSSRA